MLSTIIKVTIIIVMTLGIGWGGLCVYANIVDKPPEGTIEMPNSDDAEYSIYIENTGNLLLTSDYEVHGSEPGLRTYILNGFWQVSGNSFKYNGGTLILEEKIFGKITVGRRK